MTESQFAYDDRGAGPAVILLHGYPFDRSMWRAQIDSLSASGYRVIVPDLLGRNLIAESGADTFGIQAEAGRTTTMADMARHVVQLMDELKIDQAAICGLSMGGYVALEFVHLFPERVRALVLAGTRAPADNEQEKLGRLKQTEEMLAKGMLGIAEASVPKLLAPKTVTDKPEISARVREMILRADPMAAAAAQRGMAGRRDYANELSHINVPALILVGRQDPIRPVGDAEFMHRGIKNSQLEIIADAAHLTNLEQPEIFNRALMSFLAEVMVKKVAPATQP